MTNLHKPERQPELVNASANSVFSYIPDKDVKKKDLLPKKTKGARTVDKLLIKISS